MEIETKQFSYSTEFSSPTSAPTKSCLLSDQREAKLWKRADPKAAKGTAVVWKRAAQFGRTRDIAETADRSCGLSRVFSEYAAGKFERTSETDLIQAITYAG